MYLILERLLNLLAIILSGDPFTQAGAPTKIVSNRDGLNPYPEADDATIELALEVLGTFSFKGIYSLKSGINPLARDTGEYSFYYYEFNTRADFLFILVETELSLSEFIRNYVVRYVEDDNPDIRKAAALSCCQVLAADPVVTRTSHHAIKLVNEVLEKLLTLAIADPG